MDKWQSHVLITAVVSATMMKICIICILIGLFTACNDHEQDKQLLQAQVDSLRLKLDKSYKPGLGEFMSGIQVHHAKLWFAGKAGNWPLADFETKEIQETLEDIRSYCTDRPELAYLPMITAPLDSLNSAIRNKDFKQFQKGFSLLTITCNNCHRITKHAFNVIQIPTTPPFSNQDFQNQPEPDQPSMNAQK